MLLGENRPKMDILGCFETFGGKSDQEISIWHIQKYSALSWYWCPLSMYLVFRTIKVDARILWPEDTHFWLLVPVSWACAYYTCNALYRQCHTITVHSEPSRYKWFSGTPPKCLCWQGEDISRLPHGCQAWEMRLPRSLGATRLEINSPLLVIKRTTRNF